MSSLVLDSSFITTSTGSSRIHPGRLNSGAPEGSKCTVASLSSSSVSDAFLPFLGLLSTCHDVGDHQILAVLGLDGVEVYADRGHHAPVGSVEDQDELRLRLSQDCLAEVPPSPLLTRFPRCPINSPNDESAAWRCLLVHQIPGSKLATLDALQPEKRCRDLLGKPSAMVGLSQHPICARRSETCLCHSQTTVLADGVGVAYVVVAAGDRQDCAGTGELWAV